MGFKSFAHKEKKKNIACGIVGFKFSKQYAQ